MTPLKAVRKYCLACMLNQPNEIQLCPSDDCVLFSYRFGKNVKNKPTLKLKIIRAKCLDCSDGFKDVRDCWDKKCSLYPFRMGKRGSL